MEEKADRGGHSHACMQMPMPLTPYLAASPVVRWLVNITGLMEWQGLPYGWGSTSLIETWSAMLSPEAIVGLHAGGWNKIIQSLGQREIRNWSNATDMANQS